MTKRWMTCFGIMVTATVSAVGAPAGQPAPPAPPAAEPNWVESTAGPGPGDSGPGTGTILLREILNPEVSAARTPYNHPSDMHETTDGTLV